MDELVIQLGLLVAGLVGFGVWGATNERRHVADLERREAALAHVVALDTRTIPEGFVVTSGHLVTGNVVQAADFLKVFLMQWRGIFGGEVLSMGRVLTRARREALLRAKAEAKEKGSNLIVNVRFETSTIGQQKGRSGMPSSEILCYGTALITQ